ncbi:hypothetical protein F1737_00530 [Methanoplanus sp. FWC-SCC4]|uniref:Uncharacterized protein n=1 Tax=Methanochimaera problematica TaxID=2609417 RepID=A0AA97I341_9EURY|nr:hypothetical protein [Methanoplanus sp. FWC-SCC4]WOF15269.1 hypothetical protein F1737_00530 [Methanoplanus sp. FWC-SCC4]
MITRGGECSSQIRGGQKGVLISDLAAGDPVIVYLILVLAVFLAIFMVYIFPFFLYMVTGSHVYGKNRSRVLFLLSLFLIIVVYSGLYYAGIPLSPLDFIVTYSFVFGVAGLALITSYSVFEKKFLKNYPIVPYLVASLFSVVYLLFLRIVPGGYLQPSNPYFSFEIIDADIYFMDIFNSMNQNFVSHSLAIGLFSYVFLYLEIMVISAVVFAVISWGLKKLE